MKGKLKTLKVVYIYSKMRNLSRKINLLNLQIFNTSFT